MQDVKDVGIRGEIVDVKRGHMRNYLYPWKHAVYAKGNESLELSGNEPSRVERDCLSQCLFKEGEKVNMTMRMKI